MNIPYFPKWLRSLCGASTSSPAHETVPAPIFPNHQLDLDDPWLRFMIFAYKPHGYGFRDALGFNRVEFDTHHDFIQWLFPNRVGSPVNPYAPRLSDQHVDLCGRLPELRDAVEEGIAKFYRFLGFREVKGGFVRADDFEKGFQYWVSRLDHNHRRISRLLTFLCEIGLRDRAFALLSYLKSELAPAGLSEIEATAYWDAILAPA